MSALNKLPALRFISSMCFPRVELPELGNVVAIRGNSIYWGNLDIAVV